MSSMLTSGDLERLLAAIQTRHHLPGCLVEGGVFEGDTALAMMRAAPTRRMHLFDTFTGLPALAENAGTSADLEPGRFAAPLALVAAKFTSRPVTFHAGVFPASIEGLDLPPICVAHLDFDLEEPTAAALAYCWPRLVPGGLLVLDDITNGAAPGVRRAVIASGLPFEVVSCHAYIAKPGTP